MLNFFRVVGVKSVGVRSSVIHLGVQNLQRTLLAVACVWAGSSALAQTAPLEPSVAVWRPSEGVFYVSLEGKLQATKWGQPGDIPVVGDYNGDGRLDFAVWRPQEGNWYVMAPNATLEVYKWGQLGDVPVPADFDGDKRTDFAVWRPSDGTWYVQRSVDGKMWAFRWGQTGDVPLVGRF